MDRHPIREGLEPAIRKFNAQAEIDNAIANAYVHAHDPTGHWARYVDTLCGEEVHWTKLDRCTTDSPRTNLVSCPVCWKLLKEEE